MSENTFDERDAEIVKDRAAALDAVGGPRVGDWVDFPEGVTRRISYIWPSENDEPEDIQTSEGGSFYLGDGYVSFSGSLHSPVPAASLRQDGQREGAIWVFHHDYWAAGRGVNCSIPFRVFQCSEAAPR